MGRIILRSGVRFCLRGEWFVVRDILLGQQFLVESQSLGGKAIKTLAEIEMAFLDGELKFEITMPHHVIRDENTAIAIDYSIKDFECLPANVREEAWRRYQIIRPILGWPPQQRTRARIEEYVRKLREGKG